MNICIAILGHSIVRCHDGSFRSSGIYQEVTYPETPKEFPYKRTGIENRSLHGSDATAYLGGGEMVVRAGITCAQLVLRSENTPVFLLPAGRPNYIDEISADPFLSEGSVMADEIRMTLGENIPITIQAKNRTTADDAVSILKASMHYDATIVIPMAFRIARLEMLFQESILKKPEYETALARVSVIPAEAFLPQLTSWFLEMSLSPAYARTMKNERFGIRSGLETGKTPATGGIT